MLMCQLAAASISFRTAAGVYFRMSILLWCFAPFVGFADSLLRSLVSFADLWYISAALGIVYSEKVLREASVYFKHPEA